MVTWRSRFIVALSLATLAWCEVEPARAQASGGTVWSLPASRWAALGTGASVDVVTETDWPSKGASSSVARYRYGVGPGRTSLVTAAVSPGALVSAKSLRLALRSDRMASIALTLEEQGGGRWTLPLVVQGAAWRRFDVPLSAFVLQAGKDAPPDDNGRLDLQRVQRVSLLDMSAMIASGSEQAARLFGIAPGERQLLVGRLEFSAASTSAASAPAVIDGFADGVAPWSVFGARSASPGTSDSSDAPGLSVDYQKGRGSVMALVRPLSSGSLGSSRGIDVRLVSREAVKLAVQVETVDGGKFETSFDSPTGTQAQSRQLEWRAFRRADDSATRDATLDPARISSLTLMDVGGLLAGTGDNTLRLQSVLALDGPGSGSGPAGTPAAIAPSNGNATARTDEDAVQVPGWATWRKRHAPVLTGPFSLVGDPSVIRDGRLLRMFYTCYDPRRKGPAICQATSTDGLAWSDVPVDGPLAGLMLKPRPGQWDDTHETPLAVRFKGRYLLYFTGYRDRGGHFKSFPLQIGLASSADGVHFERDSDDPVLKVSADGYDSDAVFSPSIVEVDGRLVMYYTAYCLDSCRREKGVYIMAATSDDGKTWVKRTQPVFSKANYPSARNGIGEVDVVRAPDGMYYAFVTLLMGDDGHDIGLARSAEPFGPWEFVPQPVVRRSKDRFDDIGPIAPSVLIEDGKVRMWFHGFGKRKTIQIGYAEAPWPLRVR